MAQKTITISFENQTTSYKLGTNFDVMRHRADNNSSDNTIFDFRDDSTSKNYQAKNQAEYNALISFLKSADATGDGIIDDNDSNALDKKCPENMNSVQSEDGGNIIQRYNERTGEYTILDSFGI